jgi:hypothetical protein
MVGMWVELEIKEGYLCLQEQAVDHFLRCTLMRQHCVYKHICLLLHDGAIEFCGSV